MCRAIWKAGKGPRCPFQGPQRGVKVTAPEAPGTVQRCWWDRRPFIAGGGRMARDGTGEQVEGLGEHAGLTEPVSMLGAASPHI